MISARRILRAVQRSYGIAPHVYFITPREDDCVSMVKIGSALDVEMRLGELQVGSPVLLEIAHIIERGGRDLERDYHRRFERSRMHGEWFSYGYEIREEIQKLKRDHCRRLGLIP